MSASCFQHIEFQTEIRPKARGLAVPGMVGGSPGMEGAAAEPYDVMLFRTDGSARVFSRY